MLHAEGATITIDGEASKNVIPGLNSLTHLLMLLRSLNQRHWTIIPMTLSAGFSQSSSCELLMGAGFFSHVLFVLLPWFSFCFAGI